jgi:flagellar basal-body rod protein FlgG
LGLAILASSVACWWYLYQPPGTRKTGRELDVAIFGRGHFVCADPNTNATWYTRDGHLLLNAQGQLCAGRPVDGLILEPNITIPPDATNVSIASDGTVLYGQTGQAQLTSAGQLTLATFQNAEGLREVLPGFYEQTDDTGQPQINQPGFSGTGLLQSGYLEAPLRESLDLTQLLLLVLCAVVGWLAWEVRCLRLHRDSVSTVSTPTPPA